MKTYAQQALLLGIAIVGLMATGCHSVCWQNEKGGIGHITCQPMDVTTNEGAQAVFEVRLMTKEANYQWYYNGNTVNPTYTIGGNSNRLTVLKVGRETLGDYWCEIDIDKGAPIRTRTRIAKLYRATQVIVKGNIPPTPGTPPSLPVPGTMCDSPYCNYAVYPATGSPWMPDPGTTKYVAKVRLMSATGSFLPNAAYELRRKWGVTSWQCATNIGTYEKGGACTVVGQKFTVYLKPGYCDTNTYPLFLEVNWLP